MLNNNAKKTIDKLQHIIDRFVKVNFYSAPKRIINEPHDVEEQGNGEYLLFFNEILSSSLNHEIRVFKSATLEQPTPDFTEYTLVPTPPTKENECYVDRENNLIKFHSSQKACKVTVTYYSIGVGMLSSALIYTHFDSNNKVIETLHSLTKKCQDELDRISAVTSSEQLKNELRSYIESILELMRLYPNPKEVIDEVIELMKSVSTSKAELEASLLEAERFIEQIRLGSNKFIIINPTDWVRGEEGRYKYEHYHNLNTTNLNITTTQIINNVETSTVLDYEKSGNNKIIFYTVDNSITAKAVISATYFPGILGNTDIGVISADNLEDGIEKVVMTVDDRNNLKSLKTDIVNKLNKSEHEQFKTTIDKNISNINSQIEQTKNGIATLTSSLEQNTQQLNTSLEFGEIKFPSDFIKVPFKFYRDFDSKIKHNIDFNKYKKGTKVYVDFSASASGADGSETKPYKTLKTAIQNITTGIDDSYTIICKSYRFDRNSCPEAFTLTNKNISIIPYDNSSNIIMTNHSTGLIWENEEGIWKTTRSSVCEVFDLRNTDVYNLPVPLTHSETLSTCKSTQNTWFTDGVSVWINTIDGLKPTDEYFIIGTGQGVIQPKLINSTLYLENCRILANNQATYSKFDGDINSSLILNNVTSIGGNSKPNAIQQSNGFNITNFGLTALFNCKSAYCGLDGFNYHFQNISTEDRRKCLVVEYNCLSYKCGLLDSSATSDNGTTAHEGINILRIGTIAYETNGPVLADVDDCYSICIDCNIRDSISTNPSFCDNYKFAGIGDGKAVLINCGSSGNVAYDLNSNIPTYLRRFKGRKIKFKDKINYI